MQTSGNRVHATLGRLYRLSVSLGVIKGGGPVNAFPIWFVNCNEIAFEFKVHQ